MSTVNWTTAIKPLVKKYSNSKHPLEYKNNYQLLVMVMLAAQDSDKHINQIAANFFQAFPTMAALSKATEAAIQEQLKGVRNFANKAKWLDELSKQIKKDANIPLKIEELTALPGIGRKSANVIKREAGAAAEGVMVDLHTIRVAPRLGIVTGTEDAKKIEKQLMEILPQKLWDAGMAMSFLGREICRPTPICDSCLMRPVCNYYQTVIQPGSANNS